MYTVRALLVALLLLLPLLPVASAEEPYLDYDISDPAGDARNDWGEPSDIGAADILRFQVRKVGDQIEQIVTLAAPPATGEGYNEDFTLRVHDHVEPHSSTGDGILLQHEVDNNTQTTSRNDFFSGPDGAFPAEVEIDGNVVTFRFPASALDGFPCFAPAYVEVFYRAGIQGHPEYPPVDATDDLTVSPNLCDHPDASTEGLNGTCSSAAPPSGVAFDQTVTGSGEDLVRVTSRWAENRITDTLTFKEPLRGVDVDLRLEHTLEMADPEDFMDEPRKVTVHVRGGQGGLTAVALDPAEYGEKHLFPVEAHIDGANVVVSWCAAAMPELTCHSLTARGAITTEEGEMSANTGYEMGEDPCYPLPDEEGSSGSSGSSDTGASGSGDPDSGGLDTGTEGTDQGTSGSDAAKESPGASGLLAGLALAGAGALAARRRS